MLRSTTRQIASDPGNGPKRAAVRGADDEPALVDVHRVVGEHEPDPTVLAQRLAEGGAPPRVIGGDVVGAACYPEPAHAMGQACRGEPHLGIAKTGADLPQHCTLRTRSPSRRITA